MTDTMRAAVFLGPREMELRDVPRPVAGPGEVLLKIAACAVCGTDLRIYSGGKTRGVSPPRVLGHEIAGVVVDVGPGAEQYTDVSLGDRVATPPGIPCLACRFCNSGHENLCQRRSALGYRYDGGFAEFMLVPAVGVQRGLIYRIPEALSDVEAALAEPLACVVNGQRKNGIVLGDVVLVIGAGPIGLMHLQLARLQGARKVLVSEPSAPRRALAGELGATRTIDPTSTDLIAAVQEETGGVGADVTVAAIGVAQITNTLLSVTRPGGRVNLFAGYSGTGEATIEANLIHYGELIVTGTNACTREDFRIALDLLAGGQLRAGPLVSHRFPLREIERAFETTRSGEGLRVVVEP
ncbi:MAG TPA: zinc-dependent dehydrogenase [Chloroflexota bacterium]|nr:zinc-dependent dehydrogenase [Chloroflexota bacterium]